MNAKTTSQTRTPVIAVTLGLLLIFEIAGCAGTTAKQKSPTIPTETVQQATETVAVRARVASVNSRYKFVVLNFAGQSLPAAGSQIDVCRNGKKVGRVHVTEPMRGQHCTADVLEGEIQVGDQIH